MASPRAAEPAAGRPTAIRATVISSASTTLATAARIRPTASAACLPTAVDPISSRRPASSSARVCRITMKMLISAASTAAVLPIFHVVSAPTESPYSGPARPSRVALWAVLL